MADSPLVGADGVLGLELRTAGRALNPPPRLISLSIHRAVNAIPWARLEIADGEPDDGFPLADAQTLEPGVELEIALGHQQPLTTVFKGVVVRMGLAIAGQDGARLVIECRDAAVAMTLARRSAHHVDQLDSDIARTLIGRHPGLTARVAATTVRHRGLAQFHCSDWDFLLARAEASGQVVTVVDGRVSVGPPQTEADAVLTITHGQDLIAFEADTDGRQQRAGLARIRGRVRFPGSARPLPAGVLELAGVGARFGGRGWIAGVRHEVCDGEWTTEVELGPAGVAERQASKPPSAGGPQPGVHGLQVGVVQQIHDDPDGEHRIKVTLPATAVEGDSGLWARMLQFHASSGFGAFFPPEVGDEVLLGFLDADPSQPLVLGGLYGSRRAPPRALAAENRLRSLVTRCGSVLEFDEHDRLITLKTPAANQLVFSDQDKSITLQDQNGNKIVLGPDGILLQSPRDVVVQATGSVQVTATQAIEAKATADLKLAGLNVDATAQVALAARGTASAELSAAGPTTVKGALVMIN